jgi:hypothetical protein
MYPESTSIAVLLGPDRVLRDNVPCKVLCENFQLLKLYIQAATSQKSGPSKIQIRVPEVTPVAFDLVVQFVICNNIMLDANPNEEQINSILELVEAAIHLGLPGLTSLITRMVFKLRGILSNDHLALKRSHIRGAYGLEKDGEPIQELFVLASVRRYLQYQSESRTVSQFEDGEDDGMNAAQQASYSGSEFVFSQEMKRIPQYKEKLWEKVHECLATREREKRRPERGPKPAVWVAVYTDPLTDNRFEM